MRAFLARPGYAFSDAEAMANLAALYALTAVVEAAKLAAITDLGTRPGLVPDRRQVPALLAETFTLSHQQATRDAAAARAITTELPRLGAALAAGQVHREHLDVAVAVARRLPKALKTQPVPTDPIPTDPTDGAGEGVRRGIDVIDEVVTEHSRTQPAGMVRELGERIVHLLDPDRADRFDAAAYERRTGYLGRDFTGMGYYRFIVDQATDLRLRAIITAWAAPRPAGQATTGDGQSVPVRDARSHGQRLADAFTDLVLTADTVTTPPPDPQGSDPDTGDGGAGLRPRRNTVQVCIIATVDQVAAAGGATDPAAQTSGLARHTTGGTPTTVDPAVLARYTCDNPLRRILLDPHGAVLHHGRSHRLATTAQRTALTIRDSGCIIPGCALNPAWCDIHHLTPWADGGHTTIDDMVMLCGRHHTAHHAGLYDIQIRDGIPWVRPRRRHHPSTTWKRNLTHHTHTTTRSHGQGPPEPDAPG